MNVDVKHDNLRFGGLDLLHSEIFSCVYYGIEFEIKNKIDTIESQIIESLKTSLQSNHD